MRDGAAAVEAVHQRFPHFGSGIIGDDPFLDVGADVKKKE